MNDRALPAPEAARPSPPLAMVAERQPPLLAVPPLPTLTVLLASLARGGAERIVLDWLATRPPFPVQLILLHDQADEYPEPPQATVVRWRGHDLPARARELAGRLAGSPWPWLVAHLVGDALLAEFWQAGVQTLPVIHNSPEGWRNDPRRWAIRHVPQVIACADAVADALRGAGCRPPVIAIKHAVTPAWTTERWAARRRQLRERLHLPPGTPLLAMIGSFKPQKAYPRAIRVLAVLRRQSGWEMARLLILGGWPDAVCRTVLGGVLDLAARLGVADHVLLPGAVPDAVEWLPAADLVLNTSLWEGRSIATLEALAHGLPVVATAVGGQTEINDPRLSRVPVDAPPEVFAEAIATAPPARFPDAGQCAATRRHARLAAGLWTLPPLAHAWRQAAGQRRPPLMPELPWPPGGRGTLFITANLNAGGAQRSLTRLLGGLAAELPLALAVCGVSTQTAFADQLAAAGVVVFRPAETADPLAITTQLLAAAAVPASVCFWNADPKLKLLLARGLPESVRLIDVSPGADLFVEMEAAADFAAAAGIAADAYWRRLDRLVHKFRAGTGDVPRLPLRRPAQVIPNGVPLPRRPKCHYPLPPPPQPIRIAVSGRVAPSKQLELLLAALAHLRAGEPRIELHVFGAAEPRHADYAAGLSVATGVVWHGPTPDVGERLADFDLFLCLGQRQGCPNATLEALAAGLPVIANNSGGTREQVIDGRTGLLLCAEPTVAELVAAARQLLDDRGLAARLGRAGREHVARAFSETTMRERYRRLLENAQKTREKGSP